MSEGAEGRQSCSTDSSACAIWCCLQVDGVRIVWNTWCEWGNTSPHQHTHIGIGLRTYIDTKKEYEGQRFSMAAAAARDRSCEGGGEGSRIGRKSFQTKMPGWHMQKEREKKGGFLRKCFRTLCSFEKVLASPMGHPRAKINHRKATLGRNCQTLSPHCARASTGSILQGHVCGGNAAADSHSGAGRDYEVSTLL